MSWYTMFCPPSHHACIHFFSLLFISEHKEHQVSLPCCRCGSFLFAFLILSTSRCSVLLFCSRLYRRFVVWLLSCTIFSPVLLLLASVLFSFVRFATALHTLYMSCYVLHCSLFSLIKCYLRSLNATQESLLLLY